MHRVRIEETAGQHALLPSERDADLQAVLKAGRVQLPQFAPREQKQAQQFYASLAGYRTGLATTTARAIAASQAKGLTELHAMGSSQYGTVLHDSDIDLYAPIPPTCPDLDTLRTLLGGHAEYRKTRSAPTHGPRHLFAFQQDGIDVDLNLVEATDYRLAVTVVREITEALSEADLIANTWIKHLLHKREDPHAYDQWKTAMRLHGSATLRRFLVNDRLSPSQSVLPDTPPPMDVPLARSAATAEVAARAANSWG
ncbi:hypothetical protein [Streptacidiphilus sp. P02-A3a]|uniref:hypothetical protein n=1 Tax=Streptacidiphilus sp. P02-A3a TaxID=2704468 RepID=UPI0015FB78C5|nr:hypothetical protein [Streptacidiphilus sp. P02-A3a]QMU67098.1 hypothetical protein GXP74_01605 [Streptacidiphilus sp. P02-A3a]